MDSPFPSRRRATFSSWTFALLATLVWQSCASAQVQNPANRHYYDVIGGAIPWSAAKSAAEQRVYGGVSGHLATIQDAAENDWLVSTFGPSTLANTWLGGYQNLSSPSYGEPAGGWEWVTGEPMGYANWSSGEPNGGSDSDYMEIKSGGSPPGGWNDVQGGEPENRGYVVEFDLAGSSTPPPNPSPCSASDDASASVIITWANVPDESGYRIRRDGAVIAILGPDVTYYFDVPPAGTYAYCTEAFNEAGTSTPCCDFGTKLLGAPARPGPCSASDNSTGSVFVSWTNVVDETYYQIIRDGVIVAQVGPDVTSYIDVPSPGTYAYCIVAVNAAGASAGCCDSGTRLIPFPQPPGPCSASDNSSAGVKVEWTDVAFEEGYRIYRNGALVGTAGPNMLFYYDVPAPNAYQYCVRAYNAAGESLPCCDVGVRLPPSLRCGGGVWRLHMATLDVQWSRSRAAPNWVTLHMGAESGWARLVVFDARGAVVRRLLREWVPAEAERIVAWDGRDELGRRVPAGVYFIRFDGLGVERTARALRLE